jgi:dTDP-4-amino-4,6-dideoxygalactose transaminase
VVYANHRNALIGRLAEAEIETAVHYPRPIHLQPAYSALGYPLGTFPHAERACERVLSLPIFPAMTAEQATHVANSVRDAVGQG